MNVLPSFRRLLVIGVPPATCSLGFGSSLQPIAFWLLVLVLAGLLAFFALCLLRYGRNWMLATHLLQCQHA